MSLRILLDCACSAVDRALTVRNLVITAVLAVAASEPLCASTLASEHSWTPEISIKRRKYDTEAPIYSPDGTMFFIVSRSGDVARDCTIGTLEVYSNEAIKTVLLGGSSSSIAPIRKFSVETHLNERGVQLSATPIFQPEWSADGKTISFTGNDSEGLRQLFSYEWQSEEIEQLTHFDEDVSGLIFHAGDTYVAKGIMPGFSPRLQYPYQVLTGEMVADWGNPYLQARIMVERAGSIWKTGAHSFKGLVGGLGPWVSPDGNYLVVFVPVPIEVGSAEYERVAPATEAFQYQLVDVRNKTVTPLCYAPTGGALVKPLPRAVWIDATSFVISNAVLPKAERGDSNEAFVISYDVRTLQPHILEPARVTFDGKVQASARVTYDELSQRLDIGRMRDDGKNAPTNSYALSQGKWVSRATDVGAEPRIPSKETLQVSLREDANTPPRFYASLGGVDAPLGEADPILAGIATIPTVDFQWHLSDGTIAHGGLLLPTARQSQLPLIIQVGGYSPSAYSPDGVTDGSWLGAFAAQSLATQGFAVLNITFKTNGGDGSINGLLKERSTFLDKVDSAVDALITAHHIDPARVGLVGFSRGGYLSLTAATRPGRHKLRALVADDSTTGSYMLSLVKAAYNGGNREQAEYPLFWQDRELWLKEETTFNIDSVQAPCLFTTHGSSMPPATLDMMGAFMANGRPSETVSFPFANHILGMPRQLAASQELTVDWMTFWLMGREDPSLSKRGQYARWRVMRNSWKRQQAWEAAGHPAGSIPDKDFKVSENKPEEKKPEPVGSKN